MPAYFTIHIEMNKSKSAIRDFCQALMDCGLTFKSGCHHSKNDSYEDIISYNQKKLDENFELGPTDNFSIDYKAMRLTFSNYSKFYLGIANAREDSFFDFQLLIPEDYFLRWTKEKRLRKTKRMEAVKELAKMIWARLDLVGIQTAWELSDNPIKAPYISLEEPPQAEPFCIIKKSSIVDKLGLPYQEIENNGVLIENDDDWDYL